MVKIELVDVGHAYTSGDYAVRNINLSWEQATSSALLGPSGCGKTTLLKIISGLLKPTEGKVLLNGQEVNHLSPKERNIAQVFQFPVVYETLSVYDNLAFPLRNRNVPPHLVRERVYEVAQLLELSDKLKANAASLGAAEKQLISLGRGMVRKDLAAILLDEPLTVIDPHQKWFLRRKLKQLQQRFEITMIYVTHDQHEALTFAEQVTVMNMGQALQTGSPQELHNYPLAPFVGYFIGSPGMNIFKAHLRDNQVQYGDLTLSLSDATAKTIAQQDLKVGIRPEFIEVYETQAPNAIECSVTAIHLTGTAKILDLQGANLSFKARVMDTSKIQLDDTVWAIFPDEFTILYADEQAIAISTQEKAL